MAKLSAVVPIVVAVLIGTVYYATFRGIPAVAAKRNAVAFADSSHYVELLSGRHYDACARTNEVYHVEHRRKTVHHAGYVLFADAVVQASAVLVPGLGELDRIWLISPLLGAINFVLAFWLFRLIAPGLEWPAALAYSLTPATWIYAAIPETWVFVGSAVLIALLFRERSVSPWVAVPVIAALALANFLILLLVLLLQDERQPLPSRIARVAMLGVAAGLVWLGLLFVLGATLSPDFLPHRFYEQTVSFKARMGENLAIANPFRWAYAFVNGLLVPFVLNQHDLNFSYRALPDGVRAFPLGTAAVIALIGLSLGLVRHLWRIAIEAWRTGAWASCITGPAIYLAAAFVATGLALYYESFLYSPLFVPLLLVFALWSLSASPYGRPIMWASAAVWAASATQQILYFRGALGG